MKIKTYLFWQIKQWIPLLAITLIIPLICLFPSLFRDKEIKPYIFNWMFVEGVLMSIAIVFSFYVYSFSFNKNKCDFFFQIPFSVPKLVRLRTLILSVHLLLVSTLVIFISFILCHAPTTLNDDIISCLLTIGYSLACIFSLFFISMLGVSRGTNLSCAIMNVVVINLILLFFTPCIERYICLFTFFTIRPHYSGNIMSFGLIEFLEVSFTGFHQVPNLAFLIQSSLGVISLFTCLFFYQKKSETSGKCQSKTTVDEVLIHVAYLFLAITMAQYTFNPIFIIIALLYLAVYLAFLFGYYHRIRLSLRTWILYGSMSVASILFSTLIHY